MNRPRQPVRGPRPGRKRPGRAGGSTLYQVESNIDDQNPELFPWLIEKLLQNGARDAWLTPIVMKKGRAAVTLSFLAERAALPALLEMAGRESSTAGLRFFPVERRVFARRPITVDTPWGQVMAKEISSATFNRLHPEFESCKKLALEKNIPLREIMEWVSKKA